MYGGPYNYYSKPNMLIKKYYFQGSKTAETYLWCGMRGFSEALKGIFYLWADTIYCV